MHLLHLKRSSPTWAFYSCPSLMACHFHSSPRHSAEETPLPNCWGCISAVSSVSQAPISGQVLTVTVTARLPTFCWQLSLSFFFLMQLLPWLSCYIQEKSPFIQSKLLPLENIKSRASFQSLSHGLRDLPLWFIAYRWVSSTALSCGYTNNCCSVSVSFHPAAPFWVPILPVSL